MNVAELRWRDGEAPGEHLWGVPELWAADVDARCVPVSPRPPTPFWRAVSRATRNAMGPLRFERTLARCARDASVLYCTPADAVQGLALLRRLHMWTRQIVA